LTAAPSQPLAPPDFGATLGAAAEALGLALSDDQTQRLPRLRRPPPALEPDLQPHRRARSGRDADAARRRLPRRGSGVAPDLARPEARARRRQRRRPAGIVWAVVEPQLDITCVDSVGKKVAFIRQAALALRLANLRAEHARVEQLRAPPFDLVTSRAFASLADFVGLTRELAMPGGIWLAMKGKLPLDEIAALPPGFQRFTWNVSRCREWSREMPDLDKKNCADACQEREWALAMTFIFSRRP
jgi:hypothetical protein